MSGRAKTQRFRPVRRFDANRFAVQALVTLGGAAALSWETLWQLEAALSLGVSAFGAAITLATTMAGMTLGAIGMGRRLERRELLRPVGTYGLLELWIGVMGLLMRPAFRLVETIDTQVWGWAPVAAPLVHLLGIAAVLGVPSLAMGATIPVFARIAASHGTSVSRLYGLNTAGAAIGTIVVAFVLVPRFGVGGAVLTAAGINLSIACAAQLFRHPGRRAVREPDSARRDGGASRLPHPAIVVFVTGFTTFALEVLWFRSMLAAFQSTTESFAVMLASVLIALAVGAVAAPRLRRAGVDPSALLVLAALAILLATPLMERIDLLAARGLRGDPLGYASILLRWLMLSLGILGPAVVLLGTALPLYLDAARSPGATGRVYAVNTVGAVLGSILASWVLLPTLGVARSSWSIGCLVLVLAAWIAPGRWRLAIPAAGTAALLVAVSQTSSLGRSRIQTSHDLGPYEIVAFEEGPDSTVSVIEPREGDRRRRLLIDGFVASTERFDHSHYMAWMGRLPMLLHPRPEDALVIAFGTGQTAAALLDEGPRRLDVVELSRAVLNMAEHFSSNRGVLRDPRVDAITMDGRAWVRRVDRLYDVVTLEPMPPYFAGVNSLYSKEFYELVAHRLRPGGIVTQWLPLHLVTREHATAITRTFLDVFPDALLWLDPKGGTGILLGRRTPGERWLGTEWPGLARSAPRRSLSPREIRRAAALGGRAIHAYGESGEAITDSNQLLAYSLGRGRLRPGHENSTFEANMREIARHSRTALNRPGAKSAEPRRGDR